jgi:hypothetical protein
MKPYTRAVIPPVEVSAPPRSNAPARRSVSTRNRGASSAMAMPIGTLTSIPQRQESRSVKTPPMTMPTLPPAPMTAL